MERSLKTDDLKASVRRHVPDAGGAITFSPVTTGKFNDSYFVRAGNRDLVLRVAPPRESVFLFYERDMIRQEPQIHRLVSERTSCPVPEIVACDTSREFLPRDFIIMERLPGKPLSETAGVDRGEVLYQVGACLAQVHKLTAERYGYLGEHRPVEPQESWAEAFRIMWSKLLDDIEATGIYTSREGDWLRDLLKGHIGLFERPVTSSLLHMDIWWQNILVDRAGKLTGILDWDRALWGDVEIEFAVLDYCGMSEPPFWRGYGRQRDQSHEARIRNVFYLLYELQKYIVIRYGRSNDPSVARSYKKQAMNIVKGYLA